LYLFICLEQFATLTLICFTPTVMHPYATSASIYLPSCKTWRIVD